MEYRPVSRDLPFAKILGAVTVGLWAPHIVSHKYLCLITSNVINVSSLSVSGTSPILFSITDHQPGSRLGVLVTGPPFHHQSFSMILEGCDLVKRHLLCCHPNTLTRMPD